MTTNNIRQKLVFGACKNLPLKTPIFERGHEFLPDKEKKGEEFLPDMTTYPEVQILQKSLTALEAQPPATNSCPGSTQFPPVHAIV